MSEKPKEVPIYIASPDDADDLTDPSSFIDPDTDPRKLLDHERPAQWEPYVPSKTLEEASLEARTKSAGKRPGKLEAVQSIEPVEKPATEERAPSRDPIGTSAGPRYLEPEALNSSPASLSSQSNSSQPRQDQAAKNVLNRRTWLYVVLTAINSFVLGVWIGSKYVPFETPKSALDLQVSSQPAADGALRKHLVADVAARAGRSVVNIDIRYKPTPPPSQLAAPMRGFDRFFGQEGQRESAPRYPAPPRISEGTGMIIRSDGYILSNSHVVKPYSDIKVTLDDKRELKARFIGRDSFTDLAVIKVEGKDLPVAKFSSSSTVRPGDWAIAIGSPLGFDHTVTLGIVSAIGRSLSDLMNHHVELIQTDVAINPGSSGGPLLNIDGEVIGIIAAIKSGAQNIAFAIPVDLARKIAEEIISHGTIARPYLGIFMVDDDPNPTRSVTLPTHPVAVRVARVMANGPCQKAGIMPGFIIEKVKGQPVKSTKEVRSIISVLRPGDVVEFQLRRDGGGSEIKKVTVGFYPEDLEDSR